MLNLRNAISMLALGIAPLAAMAPPAAGGASSNGAGASAGRKFERLLAANETLLYFGGCMIVLLLIAWVALAITKNRLFAASKVVRPEKKGVVKNVWAEAGRRMETPPAPERKPDDDGPPPDVYPPPGNAL